MNNFSDKVSIIWSVADLLRGDYKQSEYGRVILPFVVLRRLDQVLAPSLKAVRAADNKHPVDKTPQALRERILLKASGATFYNTHALDFNALLDDPDNTATNLIAYVHGFSENVRDIMEKFDFEAEVAQLERAGLLFAVLRKFVEVDLAPYQRQSDGKPLLGDNGEPVSNVSNVEMGSIFEELIRRIAERSEQAGNHSTPRDVANLVVSLLFAEDDEVLRTPDIIRAIYDPACGTGGMLSVAEGYFSKLNPAAKLKIFGQELNPESYAICKADMLLRGQEADNIKHGDSFTEDSLPELTADYSICIPLFGVNWSRVQMKVTAEHEQEGNAGRFGPGLPRKSDGSLLFLLHMLSKMKSPDEGGSRLAIVFNGSPLFTGAAGSGESEIRRWIVERDLLEAIVTLPSQMFYNTGISTYICILSNRKSRHRRGKVQLIDGTDYCRVMAKRVGRKAQLISVDNGEALVDLYRAAKEQTNCRIISNTDLGYQTLTIRRPLQVNFQSSEARISRLEDDRVWQKLSKAEARSQAGFQESVLAVLKALDGAKVYKSRQEFEKALRGEAKSQGLEIRKHIHKIIIRALSEQDDTAEVCMRDGEAELDPGFRRMIDIPLEVDANAYMESEILSRFPLATLSEVRVGFAVKQVEHLGFGLKRALDGLRDQYKNCDLLPLGEVCKRISRRAIKKSAAASWPNHVKPLLSSPLDRVMSLRSVHLEPDEDILLPDYLAMFLSTDLGHELLGELAGAQLVGPDPADLAQLEVPVPTLADQRALLDAKEKIDELTQLLSRVESELAANPANVEALHATVTPMLRVLGQLSLADEIRELVRGGESRRVEFKETFSLDVRKQTKEIYIEESALKNVVALLNSDGGDLLIGVTDDGEFKGVELEVEKFHKGSADKLLLHLKNRIKVRIGEQYYPLIDQKLVAVSGATVLWISCKTSDAPVFLDEESFFVRTNPATDKLTGRKQHEYIKLRFSKDNA